jgi:hypothetical protein
LFSAEKTGETTAFRQWDRDVMSDAMASPTIKFSAPQRLYERAQEEAERVGVSVPQLALMALVDRLDGRVVRTTGAPEPPEEP